MFNKMNIIIFSTLLVIISSVTDCPKARPIVMGDSPCGSGLCYKIQYEQGICRVINKIVKTQWITSGIYIGVPYTYVFFQKYQNGDLILLLLTQWSYARIFYEIKQNEEALVKDGEFIPSITLESDINSQYEGNLYLIKIGEDEYPVFLGKKALV